MCSQYLEEYLKNPSRKFVFETPEEAANPENYLALMRHRAGFLCICAWSFVPLIFCSL